MALRDVTHALDAAGSPAGGFRVQTSGAGFLVESVPSGVSCAVDAEGTNRFTLRAGLKVCARFSELRLFYPAGLTGTVQLIAHGDTDCADGAARADAAAAGPRVDFAAAWQITSNTSVVSDGISPAGVLLTDFLGAGSSTTGSVVGTLAVRNARTLREWKYSLSAFKHSVAYPVGDGANDQLRAWRFTLVAAFQAGASNWERGFFLQPEGATLTQSPGVNLETHTYRPQFLGVYRRSGGGVFFGARRLTGDVTTEAVQLTGWQGADGDFFRLDVDVLKANGSDAAAVVVRQNGTELLRREWTGAHYLPELSDGGTPKILRAFVGSRCDLTHMYVADARVQIARSADDLT